MARLEVAETILAQLGGAGRLAVMLGAHGFIGDEKSLAFRFKCRGVDGSNAFRVVLDPSDTYTIEFLSLRGSKRTVRATRENVYAEDLRPIFEAQTGLRLSL